MNQWNTNCLLFCVNVVARAIRLLFCVIVTARKCFHVSKTHEQFSIVSREVLLWYNNLRQVSLSNFWFTWGYIWVGKLSE